VEPRHGGGLHEIQARTLKHVEDAPEMSVRDVAALLGIRPQLAMYYARKLHAEGPARGSHPPGRLFVRDDHVRPPLKRRRTVHGPDVALTAIERVRGLLERSTVPMSRNELLRRLEESGHATTRQRLNRGLASFVDLGVAVDGSRGVQWTHSDSEGLRRAAATGRRL